MSNSTKGILVTDILKHILKIATNGNSNLVGGYSDLLDDKDFSDSININTFCEKIEDFAKGGYYIWMFDLLKFMLLSEDGFFEGISDTDKRVIKEVLHVCLFEMNDTLDSLVETHFNDDYSHVDVESVKEYHKSFNEYRKHQDTIIGYIKSCK